MTFLNRRIVIPMVVRSSTLTIGEIIAFTLFVGLNIGWGFWNRRNELYHQYFWVVLARVLGDSANLTIGFLLLPVSRNSIWWRFFGLSFERLLVYHRFLGFILFILTTAHMICWWYGWIILEIFTIQFTFLSVIQGVNGLMAWIIQVIMTFFAMEFWRRRYFEVFYYFHHLFVVFMVFTLIHTTHYTIQLWYSAGPGVVLYFFDRLIRFRNRFKTTTVKRANLSDSNDVVLLALRQENMRYIAGQYVFICVPEISPLQWHPFSICTAMKQSAMTTDKGTDFKLGIKVQGPGSWTAKLKELVESHSVDFLEHRLNNKTLLPEMFKVLVDGPYGTSFHFLPYQHIVLIGGGIGITPMLSLMEQILQQREMDKNSSLGKVFLIWSMRDNTMLSLFREPIIRVEQSRHSRHFEIHLHCTAAPFVAEQPTRSKALSVLSTRSCDSYYTGIETRSPHCSDLSSRGATLCTPISTERFNYEEFFERLVDEFSPSTVPIRVMHCGPPALASHIGSVVAGLSSSQLRFDFDDESFEF